MTAVLFQDTNILISAGACDGFIKMWDVRKNYSCFKSEPLAYHTIPYPEKAARKHGNIFLLNGNIILKCNQMIISASLNQLLILIKNTSE